MNIPWFHTSLIVGQFGHCLRAAKLVGKLFGTSYIIGSSCFTCNVCAGRTPINLFIEAFDQVWNLVDPAFHVDCNKLMFAINPSVKNDFFDLSISRVKTTDNERQSIKTKVKIHLYPTKAKIKWNNILPLCSSKINP